MTVPTKRATIYFDPDLHKALRLIAAETSRSITDLVNAAVRQTLAEDADDLAAFAARTAEPLISYDEIGQDPEKRWPDIRSFSGSRSPRILLPTPSGTCKGSST